MAGFRVRGRGLEKHDAREIIKLFSSERLLRPTKVFGLNRFTCVPQRFLRPRPLTLNPSHPAAGPLTTLSLELSNAHQIIGRRNKMTELFCRIMPAKSRFPKTAVGD